MFSRPGKKLQIATLYLCTLLGTDLLAFGTRFRLILSMDGILGSLYLSHLILEIITCQVDAG